MMKNNNQPEIDPELLEKISLLESTPKRDPNLSEQSRQKYIAALETIPLAGKPTGLGWLMGMFKLNKSKEGYTVNNGSRKFAVSTLVAILLVVVIIFGGASATAYAAQSALPGDALYPVKTSLEQTQISLANDAYNQAQLNLEFAQRRLDEIKELLSQGRTNDIDFASSEFEFYIQEAMMASQLVQSTDPERGAELNSLVSQALLDYASALRTVLINAPDSVKPVVERALLASQDGAGDEIEIYGVVAVISDTELEVDGVVYSITGLTEFKDFIQAGDTVKIHVIKTQDGIMVVREIELSTTMDDNSNSAMDDNSNDSLDDNENEDGFNSNDNMSDDDFNENESDDDMNDNSSMDNSNDSFDDNSNDDSDDDINDNDSDDSSSKSGSSSNDNDNDDDDSNDNSSDDSNDNDSDDHEDNSGSNSNDSNSNDNERDDD